MRGESFPLVRKKAPWAAKEWGSASAKTAPWTAIVGKRSPVEKRNPFRLSEKKLRGPYSNRHQTHLAFCRDYSAVHGAIFYLKRKGFRFPTLANAQH